MELLTTYSHSPNRICFWINMAREGTRCNNRDSRVTGVEHSFASIFTLLHAFHCTMRPEHMLFSALVLCTLLTRWATQCHMRDHSGALHHVDLTHRTAGLLRARLLLQTLKCVNGTKLSLASQLKTLTSTNSIWLLLSHALTCTRWANMIW